MAFGFACILLVMTHVVIAPACPVPMHVDRVVWVDLECTPSNTPMDLVSFYDRTSVLQLFTLALLIVLTLGAAALIVERAVHYSRASRQTRRFVSLANDALFQDRAHDVVLLAARFRHSPVACVVNASLTPGAAEDRFSSFGRHTAATVQVARVARGLATLGAVATTTPIVGAVLAVEGLIRCLRVSSVFEISPDVLQNWIADWLIGLLIGLVVAFVATWAHRLLAATANRLLLEMDRLSLAFISRIPSSSEEPANEVRLLRSATIEIGSFATRRL
jgi:biopolymer transport protein ExbB/TolQ